MNTGERLGYSLAAALGADLIVSATAELLSPPSGPHHWYGFIGFAALMLVGVIPGWVVFATLVSLASDPREWSGALVVLGCSVIPYLLSLRAGAALVESLLPLATAICVLTTLLYFGLVELVSRRRIQTD